MIAAIVIAAWLLAMALAWGIFAGAAVLARVDDTRRPFL
jgi:hypothetical protein